MKKIIKITRIKEHKDGRATFTLEYGKEIKKVVRNYYNKKRATKKLVATFVKEAIDRYIDNEEIKELERGIK